MCKYYVLYENSDEDIKIYIYKNMQTRKRKYEAPVTKIPRKKIWKAHNTQASAIHDKLCKLDILQKYIYTIIADYACIPWKIGQDAILLRISPNFPAKEALVYYTFWNRGQVSRVYINNNVEVTVKEVEDKPWRKGKEIYLIPSDSYRLMPFVHDFQELKLKFDTFKKTNYSFGFLNISSTDILETIAELFRRKFKLTEMVN